jgi:Ras-related C3 botulinum toxin substrate 1
MFLKANIYFFNNYVHFPFVDLREDKQFFVDHPGAVPINTAQVKNDHPQASAFSPNTPHTKNFFV